MRETLDRWIGTLASGMALIGAVGLVAMLVHVTVYVILRHLVSAPVPATVEIVSNYYMILLAFLPLAWAERRGDMISVEILGHLFTGRAGRIADTFVALVSSAAYLALAYTTWTVAMRELAARSFVISLSVAVPTWPSYFVLPVAFALAAIISLYRTFVPPTRETHK